jgi:SAM-dependent methyltransferase
MKRSDIINRLIEVKGYDSYLEIGVDKGKNFIEIKAFNKLGVDPEVKNFIGEGRILSITSDVFFKSNIDKFDIIFIDGLHHEDQVTRDIENALECLSEGGTIVVHDCNPTTEEMQIVPRKQVVWTGDVWKAWVKLRKTRTDIFQVCIDEDYGCGIITKGNQEFKTKLALTWKNFDKNRVKLLNLISWAEYESNYLHG